MSILETLKTDTTIKEEGDSLGGFQPLASGLYNLKVKLAYVTTAASKALALNTVFETEDGKELRQQFWMTSGEAKGCKNFYIHPRTREKHYLPGFNMANALALMTTNQEISALTTESKVIKLYDPQERKEVPTKVEMVTDLLDKGITAGVILQTVNKREKNPQTGAYEPVADTRQENEIDKLFHLGTGLTVAEAKAKGKEPVFRTKWAEKWNGQIRDKTVDTGVTAGAPSAAGQASGAAAPKESLFA